MLTRANRAPILDCLVSDDIWEQGLGTALLSRELHDGTVAYAFFLIDTGCLGVKNALFGILPKSVYLHECRPELLARGFHQDVSPPYLRSLVEGSVAYASSLGLPPHPDYRIAKTLFGDIDPTEGPEFEFGREGRPFYCAGPLESAEDQERIISILRHSCGDGNFDCVLPIAGGSLALDGTGGDIYVIGEGGEDDEDVEDSIDAISWEPCPEE